LCSCTIISAWSTLPYSVDLSLALCMSWSSSD
jgi:hypothetical protein